MLHVWQSCARQLFAAADPARFIGEGASGINADATRGLGAKVMGDSDLLHTISTLELEKWPNWYMAQYDALVVQPCLVHDVLNSDENQPARVWREGRAKATGVCGKLMLHPEDSPGHQVLKPKKTSRKGIPVNLEPWIGGWQPAAGSELLHPPPCIRSAQGLPGVLAGNPKKVETLPLVFVTTYPGHGAEYAFLPLAHRIDIDRLYGLLLMCPEWSCVTCHGSHGDRYKQKTWEHMSPFEIKATFNPGTSKRCWTEDLASSLRSKQGSSGDSGIVAEGLHNDDPFTVILGITDNWENEPGSSSGAKLYIRNPNANATSRNYALGRTAALLNEEDFDQVPYLEVFYGKKWRKWGMAVSSSGVMQQKTEAHAEIGLDPAWSSAPMVEQIQSLHTAYQTCLLKGIPAGSLARSILQVACSQAAKNAVSQEMGQVQGGEFANLVGLLSKHLAIQDNEVGADMDELKPAAGHTAAGVYTGDDQWPTSTFRKGGDILDPVVVSNAMMKLAGEGAGSQEGPGIRAGSS